MIIGIGCGQPDTDSAFVDLELQAALLVIVGLLTQFRELGCVLKQPLFHLGIVSMDLCGGVFCAVINLCGFLFLGNSCFYKDPL